MYATPVIYPISTITNAKLKLLMTANPITGVIEAYKYGMLGAGSFSWGLLGYSAGFAAALMAIGIVVFNRELSQLLTPSNLLCQIHPKSR